MLNTDQRFDKSEKKHRWNSDRMIFLLSLLASVVFWLLIKLSDTYTVSYSLSVSYKNIPVDRQLTAMTDSTFTLTLTSNGYTILENLSKGKLKSVTFDLKRIKFKHRRGNKYFITRDQIKNYLSDYLGITENNIDISNSGLEFSLEKTKSKRVKVKPFTRLSFKSQFGLYGIAVVPDVVTVYGPQSILDTLKIIHTDLISEDNLENNKTLHTSLFNPLPGRLRMVPEKVEVDIDVERYTESSLEIPVDVTGLRQKIRTFPATVKVYFHVAVKDYKTIHPGMFRVEPDVRPGDLTKVNKLKLKVTRKPDLVSKVRLDPQSVEFLIIQ